MATIVHKYRVKASGSAAQRRETLGQPTMMDQFVLAHRLRNALVEIEHAHDNAKAELWQQYPATAAANAALQAADAEVLALLEQARAEHSQDRSTKTRPATAKALAAARKVCREARAARRTAIADMYALAKPQLERLQSARQAQIKALYALYCQEGRPVYATCAACQGRELDGHGACLACGAVQPLTKLYWATYNAVTQSHQTAMKLISGKRKKGEAAELRFHRFDGTGRIAVQLQKQAGDPARTGAMLSSGGGKWHNVLRLPAVVAHTDWDTLTRPEQKRLAGGDIHWSIGSGKMIVLPVHFHRPLPSDSEVLQAELVRTRIADQFIMHLCLTLRVPDPDPAPAENRPVIAVHTGWRSRSDGSVRVATWRCDSATLRVPDHLHDLIAVHDSGHTGEVVLPARWLDGAAQTASLDSRRSLSQDAIRDKVASWLDEHPQPDEDKGQLTGVAVRQWRSPNRLAALAIRWRENPPTGDGAAELAELLEAWRKQDKHLWQWRDHGRHQQSGRRNDGWRAVAAWLADSAGLLLTDDTDLAELRRRPGVADANTPDPAVPTAVADAARERAAIAAPGFLREAIIAAAQRRGVPHAAVGSAGLTRTHRACGYTAEPDSRFAASVVVTCPRCDRPYDQDHNATGLMIDRQRSGADAT